MPLKVPNLVTEYFADRRVWTRYLSYQDYPRAREGYNNTVRTSPALSIRLVDDDTKEVLMTSLGTVHRPDTQKRDDNGRFTK